jgi:hypothetical protein
MQIWDQLAEELLDTSQWTLEARGDQGLARSRPVVPAGAPDPLREPTSGGYAVESPAEGPR